MSTDTLTAAPASLGSPAAAPPMAVRNEWYPILLSRDLRTRPVRLLRFGEPIVLWRDPEGQVVGMLDRCPHKGAALSQGRVVDGTIECPFHGWRFAADGSCVAIPCDGPDARIPTHFGPRMLRVGEEHGLIWQWWGEDSYDLPAIPWLDEVTEIERTSAWAERGLELQYSFARMMESAMDVAHFAWVHGSVARRIGPIADPFHVSVEGKVIRLHALMRFGDGRGTELSQVLNFPQMFHNDFSKNTKSLFAGCPVDAAHGWSVSRIYLTNDKIPAFVRRVMSALMLKFEKRIALPQDYGIASRQWPAHYGAGSDRQIARADGGTRAFQRMWIEATRRGAAGIGTPGD